MAESLLASVLVVMNPSQEPSKRRSLSDEEITRLLRAGVRQRPLWTWRGLLFWMLLLAVPLVLLLWLVWPRSQPPALHVVAGDQVSVPGCEVTLRGQLWLAEAEAKEIALEGQEVVFAVPSDPLEPPGQEAWQKKTTSTAEGVAAVGWPAPAGPRVVDFICRLVDERQRGPVQDGGRVFLWPADTPLLLLEADRALTDMPVAEWQTRSTADVPIRPGIAESLKQVEGRKYQVVYLALAGSRPLLYQKVRGWVQLHHLPKGPVLSRPLYAEKADEDQARKEILGELKKHFHGPLAAVAQHSAEAKAFHDLGLTCFLIGKADQTPPGVTRIASWSDLPAQLDRLARPAR
jgi:hypothetical protein